MKYLQQVLKALKPKVKRYGFKREDVESFAATIAKKLDIEEDASDEDVANAIENAIDDAIPYIEAAQKHSSRIVRRKLREAREADEDDDDDDDDDEDDEDEDDDDDEPKGKKTKKSKKSKKGGKSKKSKDDDEDDDEDDDDDGHNDYLSRQIKNLTKLVKSQNDEIAKLKGDKTVDRRRKRLEKVLENTGTFGKSILRRFDKQEFEDEDDFEEFLDEVRDDLEELNKERKKSGLGKLGAPPSTKGSKSEDDDSQEEEPYTDDEIDELVDM